MGNNYRSGWSYVGEGIAWLLIFLGFGSCSALHQGYIRVGQQVSIKDNTVIEVKADKKP